jgi:hypothetical protein
MRYEFQIVTLHYSGSGAHRQAQLGELNKVGAQGWLVVDASADPESENGEIRNVLLQRNIPDDVGS